MSDTPMHHSFDQEPSAEDALLARYLDGLLVGEELRSFEARLATDKRLRDAVDLDRRMVASMGASLGPELASTLPAPPIPIERGRERVGARRSRVGIAIAAGVALVASAAALWYQHAATSQLPQTAARTPIQIYTNEVGGGFAPDWVCTDDAEMLRFTRDRFGSGLLFADRPGVTMVGWGYAEGAISDLTATLLATYNKERIVLLVDKKSADRKLIDPTTNDPGLRMFRREVGAFVLYEITPLNEPVVSALAFAVGDDVQLGPGEKGQRAGMRPTGPKPPSKGGK